jgi:hypothetical protein
MKSFIVDFWSKVFIRLSWISLFKLVLKIFKISKPSYFFIDMWVALHTFLPLLILLLYPVDKFLFNTILIIYGLIRIFEIIVYQINVIFFDEYRAKIKGDRYAIKGFRRIVILLLHNYIEIIIWYAIAYLTFNSAFDHADKFLNTSFKAIALSFYAMTSFGLELAHPSKSIGYFLYFSQAACGVFMVIVVISRFIGLLPAPRSLNRFENK